MATIQKYRRHPVRESPTAHDFVRIVEETGRVLDDLARRPQLSAEQLLDGNADAEYEIAATETLVEHKLGKAVRGWRATDIQGNAQVWRVTAPTTTGFDETKHLCLQASSAVTIKLEVW